MDSTKKRNYLILASGAMILIIFSLTDFVSFYKYNARVNSYWLQQSDFQTNETSKGLSFDYSGLTSSVNLQVSTTENDLPVKIDSCQNLKVNLDKEIKIGFSRFIPLFKITKFDSDFKIEWSGRVKYKEEFIDISKKGELAVNGKLRILGVCSAGKTKQIIYNKIQEQVRIMISEDIKNEIEKIKTKADI